MKKTETSLKAIVWLKHRKEREKIVLSLKLNCIVCRKISKRDTNKRTLSNIVHHVARFFVMFPSFFAKNWSSELSFADVKLCFFTSCAFQFSFLI
jgi:hypothetical protein